jgi:hypothetical protein
LRPAVQFGAVINYDAGALLAKDWPAANCSEFSEGGRLAFEAVTVAQTASYTTPWDTIAQPSIAGQFATDGY